MQEDLNINVRKTSRILNRYFNRYFINSKIKIQITQIHMLQVIKDNPEKINTELAELMSLDRTSFSRNKITLEELKLIKKVAAPHHLSCTFTYLTEKGEKILSESLQIIDKASQLLNKNLELLGIDCKKLNTWLMLVVDAEVSLIPKIED